MIFIPFIFFCQLQVTLWPIYICFLLFLQQALFFCFAYHIGQYTFVWDSFFALKFYNFTRIRLYLANYDCVNMLILSYTILIIISALSVLCFTVTNSWVLIFPPTQRTPMFFQVSQDPTTLSSLYSITFHLILLPLVYEDNIFLSFIEISKAELSKSMFFFSMTHIP